MSELFGLIKACLLAWCFIWFCTKDMKCNRSSEAYKQEIIEDYLETAVTNNKESDETTAPLPSNLNASISNIEEKKGGVGGTTIFFVLMIFILFVVAFRKKDDETEEQVVFKDEKNKVYFTTDSHTPYTKHTEIKDDGSEIPVWEVQNEHQKSKGRAKIGRSTSLTDDDKREIQERWKSKNIPWSQVSLCKGYWAAGNSNRAINKLMPDFSQTYINLCCACFSSALSVSEDGAQNARHNGSNRASKSAFTVILGLFK